MAATTGWDTSTNAGTPGNDPGSNNSSGFSGLQGGLRYSNGYFHNIGIDAEWWSSTEGSVNNGLGRGLDYYNANVVQVGSTKNTGYSVRCLRD